MTNPEFDDYRMSLIYYFGQLCHSMCNKVKLGMDYSNDFYNLILADGYIDIMNEYVLVVEGGDDTNFYNQDEMYDLSQKFNIILDLNYELNFYLTI